MGSFENEEIIEESYVVNEEGNYILKDYAETVEAYEGELMTGEEVIIKTFEAIKVAS